MSLKILLLQSRPDSLKTPRPCQLLVSINSAECSNKACIVGVKNIHDLLLFVNDLSNNNFVSRQKSLKPSMLMKYVLLYNLQMTESG